MIKCPCCNGTGQVKDMQEALATAPGFEDFWTAYPSQKRRSKPTALRAWRAQRIGSTTLPKVLAALEKDKQSWEWRKANGQFVCYPATWLNGRRWEDTAGELAPKDEWRGINIL